MRNCRAVDNAAVRNDRVIDLRTVNFRTRQEAWSAENRGAHIEKVEARQFTGQIQVCLEEGADGSYVFPITLKNIRVHPQFLDGLRNNVLAKVRQRILQQTKNHTPAEHINAHRSQEKFLLAFNAQLRIPGRVEA